MRAIAWLLTISYNRLLTISGGDDMFRTALFYLTIAPASGRSIGGENRHAPELADQPVYIPPWSVRLIQIQLCAVYFFTGLAKIGED